MKRIWNFYWNAVLDMCSNPYSAWLYCIGLSFMLLGILTFIGII